MPVVPDNVQNELFHSRECHAKFGQCVFCSLIDEALTFEADFLAADQDDIADFARVLQRTMACLDHQPGSGGV